jgi:subtilisin family serine protease
VRWVGRNHPSYLLHPILAQASGAEPIAVETTTLPNADLGALSRAIAGWGGSVASTSANAMAGYVRATLPSSHIADLASQEGVVWVAPYLPPRLLNNVGGAQIMQAADVRQSLGLFGAGQIVAVADTGLDVGDRTKLHPDFQGRVLKTYCLGRATPCDWSDPDGHGTHVAGSVLGSGQASGANPAAHQYPATAFAGVAPEASLVMQSLQDIGGSLSGIPEDDGDLMRQAYADGARIHSDSWGGPTGGTGFHPEYGGYTATAQQADQVAWERKDMLILFSAGNAGADGDQDGQIDPDSIGQPATAKNVVTVGASESLRATGGYNPGGNCANWLDCWPSEFGAEPIASDKVSDNANGMAAFSSRGPTDDGRVKPDVVAPGTNILSARSHHPQAGTGWGAYDDNYIFLGGTSMATPLTAGAAALAREWLARKGVSDPSAALLKGLLINGAADMSPGQYGAGVGQEIPDQRPNNVEGWGRVDLRAALDPPAPRKIWFADNQAGISTGATMTYTVSLSPPQSAAALGAAPQATTQLVQNGGFENAALAPWHVSGAAAIDASTHNSGAKSLHMGGATSTTDEVSQTLTIPADATGITLDFAYRLDTVETLDGADSLCYGLWDISGSIRRAGNCKDLAGAGKHDWTSSVAYQVPSAIVASLAGQTVTLSFYVANDDVLPSQAWIDDVALTTTTQASKPRPSEQNALRVTLAWTDYPGEPSAAKALVNDLDLEVIGPGGARYSGNQGLYPSGQCLRDGKWDACNNVEGIIVPNAAAGGYTIVVHGAQVAKGGQQPFALVASGNRLRRMAVFLPLTLRRS